jgi:putative Holliday junction resolvase
MGRVVGIDYGRARVGVSISDETKFIARALACLPFSKKFPELLKETLKEFPDIEAIVIGLPLQMNGKEGIMATEVRAFAETLRPLFSMPILFWDERLSSAQAERSLKEAEFNRKKRAQMVDELAAVLILQNYLDSR